MEYLKVGDKVYWSGNHGKNPYIEVTVTAIEVPIQEDQRNETRYDQVHWDDIRNCIVELQSGKWAYGYQLRPLSYELEEVEFYEQD